MTFRLTFLLVSFVKILVNFVVEVFTTMGTKNHEGFYPQMLLMFTDGFKKIRFYLNTACFISSSSYF